jgi:two-component system, NarL family, response regulator DevR
MGRPHERADGAGHGAVSVGSVDAHDRAEDPIGVLLVEDHQLVRAAIADTLRGAGMVVTAEAGTAEEALSLLADARPDIVLVDIDLPGVNGIALVRELVARSPDARVIMLTGSSDEAHLLTAMRAGAAGYLTKDLSPQALARAVAGAMQGDLPMPRRMAARVVHELISSERRRTRAADSRDGGLSVREQEVLTLVSAGLTDRAIGDRLGISTRTVGHHIGRILAKLGVTSRAAAARAWKSGVLDGSVGAVAGPDQDATAANIAATGPIESEP